MNKRLFVGFVAFDVYLMLNLVILKMRFLFIAATFLSFFFLACQKDEISHSASDRLLFSRDTVIFDTVFTSVGSATARFKVYNKGSQRVNISDVTLSGGSSSSFRINIDGEPGPRI